MFSFNFFNKYSLNKKIFFSFLVICFSLLIIFSLIVVPNLKKVYKSYIYNNIEQIINISTEQSKMAFKALSNTIDLQEKTIIKDIRNEIDLFKLKLEIKPKKKAYLLYELQYKTKCTAIIKEDNLQDYPKDIWFKTNKPKKITNLIEEQFISYAKEIHNKSLLLLTCDKEYLETDHSEFEKNIKINLQNSFRKSFDIHKGKIVIVHMEKEWAKNILSKFSNKKDHDLPYGISNLSSIYTLPIGKLTPKEIITIANSNSSKKHIMQNKEAITWVKEIQSDEAGISILVTTAYINDIEKGFNSSIVKIITPILFFIFLSTFLFYIVSNRLIKNIKELSLTAKQIIKGNHKVRTNIVGEDEIGLLGSTFNSMLNSIENNIKTLDKKVDTKTKKLKSSLHEKELLLKEIHHRVKNNLSITIGFIDLELSKIQDTKTKNILSNIQSRIYTMELVHTKLYQSKDFSQISYKEYISSLVEDLSNSFNLKKQIQVNLDIEDIYLNINYAIPCSLVINELITNAFKYAFKDNINPILSIKLRKIHNKINLIIKDNGKGFSDNTIHTKPKTLGLKLVNSITKSQLFGTINYTYNKGSIFKISFFIYE